MIDEHTRDIPYPPTSEQMIAALKRAKEKCELFGANARTYDAQSNALMHEFDAICLASAIQIIEKQQIH